MLSAQRRYRHPGFGLLENPNALLLGEPALSHDDGLLGLRHELTTGIPSCSAASIPRSLRAPRPDTGTIPLTDIRREICR